MLMTIMMKVLFRSSLKSFCYSNEFTTVVMRLYDGVNTLVEILSKARKR